MEKALRSSRLPSPQPPCLLPCQRRAEETALLLQSCNAGRTGAAGGGEPRPRRNTRFHPGRKGDSQTLAETRSVLSVTLRQRRGLATGNDETSVPNLGVFCLLVCLRLRRQRARQLAAGWVPPATPVEPLPAGVCHARVKEQQSVENRVWWAQFARFNVSPEKTRNVEILK